MANEDGVDSAGEYGEGGAGGDSMSTCDGQETRGIGGFWDDETWSGGNDGSKFKRGGSRYEFNLSFELFRLAREAEANGGETSFINILAGLLKVLKSSYCGD